MLQVNPYVSLESGKEMLIKKIQLQNSLGDKGIDTSSTLISIFGSKLKDTIRHGAELCNINSSQLAALDPKKGKDAINELCSNGSQRINELHETLLWGINAGKDILNTKGLSAEGQAAAQSTIQKTAEFGQSVVKNAANNFKQAVTEVNKAASKIEAQQGEPPAANEAIKKEIKSTVEKVEKQLPQTTDVADKVKLDKKPAETLADKNPAENKTTESKSKTKPGTDIRTKTAETKQESAPGITTTEIPKAETKQTTTQNAAIENKVDITKGLAKATVENNIFADKTVDIPSFEDTTTTTAPTTVTANV